MGCLEPGRDGVGDYCVGLAGELQQQGHEVILVALVDTFAKTPSSGRREAEVGVVPTLRLPATLPWPERVERARKALDEFDPAWVSFQFVCYTYHPKGLVHGLSARLAPLYKGRKVHIMFHEIWLCKEQGWGWKHRAIGAVQRHFIRQFVRDTNPRAMHTSNAAYGAILRRNAIPVEELGIFGNVPVGAEPGSDWIEAELKAALGPGYRREGRWLFGMFGSLHRQWPPEPLLSRLHRLAQANGKKPVLGSIGRIGKEGEELWNRMAHEYADRFGFVRLGEQSIERLAEYLSRLDFGIATTPRSIIAKSGTVIAMLEHGLPVIVNRDDAPGGKGVSFENEPQLILCDADFEMRLREAEKGPRVSRRPRIARTLVNALENEAMSELAHR